MLSDNQVAQLVPLLAKKFIQRRDPIAQQMGSGGYRPLRDDEGKPYTVFDRQTLTAHLKGGATYGHYLLDSQDKCKLFVLDIDLTKTGTVPTLALNPDPTETDYEAWVGSFVVTPDLRAVWHSRERKDAPARAYIKQQLRQLGEMFAVSIHTLLGIETAVAYTGNKGVHTYGFLGSVSASDARDAAEVIVDSFGWLVPTKGDNFFGDERADSENFDPAHFHNFHVEVFPKQRSLAGKDLGNLVRLPLGRNLHAPADPTFFVDLTRPANELSPVDPVYALTTSNPWATAEEMGFTVA